MKKEIWYNIPWYENIFQISNTEKIRRINYDNIIRFKNKNNYIKELTVFIDAQWYKRCVAKYKSKIITFKIHRLYAKLFVKNVNNNNIVNHIDWNKLNNNINNLEWTTIKWNISHYTQSGFNKYCKKVVVYNREWIFIWEYISISECVRQLNLTSPYKSLKNWYFHHGYKIQYKNGL